MQSFCAHNVKEKNMYSIVKEMKQYAEVMTYSKNKKVDYVSVNL